jgi:hypothetical protein
MNAAEALASCLAKGRGSEICQDMIASQSVNGVYCDGTLVIEEGGRRCIPAAVVERTEAARAADPLPASARSTAAVGVVVVGALLVAGLVVVVLARRP